MQQLKNGGPAFPVYMVVGDVEPQKVVEAINKAGANGVTLRAYLMANASSHHDSDYALSFSEQLLGEMAPPFGKPEYFEFLARADARWRALQADAMLAELAGKPAAEEFTMDPAEYNKAARELRQAHDAAE